MMWMNTCRQCGEPIKRVDELFDPVVLEPIVGLPDQDSMRDNPHYRSVWRILCYAGHSTLVEEW